MEILDRIKNPGSYTSLLLPGILVDSNLNP